MSTNPLQASQRSKTHNEELHNFTLRHTASGLSNGVKMRRESYVSNKGETRYARKIFVRKSRWKKRVGKPGRRWEDNIKMN